MPRWRGIAHGGVGAPGVVLGRLVVMGLGRRRLLQGSECWVGVADFGCHRLRGVCVRETTCN